VDGIHDMGGMDGFGPMIPDDASLPLRMSLSK